MVLSDFTKNYKIKKNRFAKHSSAKKLNFEKMPGDKIDDNESDLPCSKESSLNLLMS
jgi:hypothetical protein